MEEIIHEINTNFDLLDFLSYKYDLDKNKIVEIKYDSLYIKEFRDKINWDVVSISAPLCVEEIDLYFEELRGCRIINQYGPAVECRFSKNTNIKWTESILEKYQKHLDWHSICENPAVPWNEKLIDKYLLREYNNISNWIALSSNPTIDWNEYLLKKYFSHLYLNCIIKYSNIFWSNPLIRCVLELTPKEDKRIYLEYFSEILNIEWDLDLLIDFPISYSYWVRNILKNKTIKLSFAELRNKINWIEKDLFQIIQLSEELIWNCESISEFYEYINFKTLSASNNVQWSAELIDTFQNDFDFKIISSNSNIFINEELIIKYINKWNFILLSRNYNTKWTLELIEENIDEIELIKVLEFSEIQFTPEFIDKHRRRISWEGEWKKLGSDSYYYDAAKISQLCKIPIAIETLQEMTSTWKKGCDLVRVGTKDEEQDIGEWHYYSNNMFLTDKHLEIFKNQLSWNILSSNKHFKLSENVLIKYASNWDYSEIMKREDLNWNVDLFCKICRYLNWDILRIYEDKVMEILKPAENIILNHFTFGKIFWRTLHSANWYTSSGDREYNELISSLEEKICENSLIEFKVIKADDSYQFWHWLRKYSSLYYKSSLLTESLMREDNSHNDIVRKFIYKYQRVLKEYKSNYNKTNEM